MARPAGEMTKQRRMRLSNGSSLATLGLNRLVPCTSFTSNVTSFCSWPALTLGAMVRVKVWGTHGHGVPLDTCSHAAPPAAEPAARRQPRWFVACLAIRGLTSFMISCPLSARRWKQYLVHGFPFVLVTLPSATGSGCQVLYALRRNDVF
jgi:hypothetical protein